jgi:hypothetical protein
MTSALVVPHFSYLCARGPLMMSCCFSRTRVASSEQANAMVAQVCFRGAKVRYRSIIMS